MSSHMLEISGRTILETESLIEQLPSGTFQKFSRTFASLRALVLLETAKYDSAF